MKKIIVALSTALVLMGCSNSNKYTMKNAEEKMMGYWKLYSVSGELINLDKKKISLDFSETGDVTKIKNDVDIEKGVWVYDKETQILQIKFGERNEPLKLFNIDEEFLSGVAIKNDIQSTDTIILKR